MWALVTCSGCGSILTMLSFSIVALYSDAGFVGEALPGEARNTYTKGDQHAFATNSSKEVISLVAASSPKYPTGYLSIKCRSVSRSAPQSFNPDTDARQPISKSSALSLHRALV